MSDGAVSQLDRQSVPAPPANRRGRRIGWAALGLLGLLLVASLWFVPKSWLPVEKSNRAVCNKTLRAIGMSIQMYVADYHNQMPPDLQTLMTCADVPPSVLVCRSSNDQPAAGPTTQAIWKSFSQPGHCSYALASPLPASGSEITPSHVLAYEINTANHGDGAHVLFGDGRVDFLAKPEYERVVAELKAGHNPPGKAK